MLPSHGQEYTDYLLSCLFAEDIGLSPPNLFWVLLERKRRSPAGQLLYLPGTLYQVGGGGEFLPLFRARLGCAIPLESAPSA